MSMKGAEYSFVTDGIGKILNKELLKVPSNQRPYAWKQEHVRELLDDIKEAMSDGSEQYFLGTVVLVESEHGRKLIADGQQRIATASIIRTGRLNELGNAIEEPLLQALLAENLSASWPKRADGSGGRSGYPDIAIDASGDRPTYVEAKVVGAGSEASSFRSFYLSPSERPKVCYDARHVLVAFTHRREHDSTDGMEQYSLVSFKVVDHARVFGKIKFEYQSSNKDMYLGNAVVLKG